MLTHGSSHAIGNNPDGTAERYGARQGSTTCLRIPARSGSFKRPSPHRLRPRGFLHGVHWQARTPLPSDDDVIDVGCSRDEVEDLAHVTMCLRGLELSELFVSANGEDWKHIAAIRRHRYQLAENS